MFIAIFLPVFSTKCLFSFIPNIHWGWGGSGYPQTMTADINTQPSTLSNFKTR